MDSLEPVPRVKSSLWKFTLWILVFLALSQFLWLFSIPFFRKTISVETEPKDDSQLKLKKQIPANIRSMDTPSPENQQQTTPATNQDSSGIQSLPPLSIGHAPSQIAPIPPPLPSAQSSGNLDDIPVLTPSVSGFDMNRLPLDTASSEPSIPMLLPKVQGRLSVASNDKDKDDTITKLNREAREFRAMGDFSLAKAKLLEALEWDTKNPHTLSSLASLHEASGDLDSAKEIWKTVMQLKSDSHTAIFIARASSSLEAITKREQDILKEEARKQHVKMRASLPQEIRFAEIVPVESQFNDPAFRVTLAPKAGVSSFQPSDVRIQTFFFEEDKESVMPISSKVTVEFESKPIDWAGGSSEIFTAKAPLIPGRGTVYHGYLMRVFYKGKLQDELAEPPQLSTLFPPH